MLLSRTLTPNQRALFFRLRIESLATVILEKTEPGKPIPDEAQQMFEKCIQIDKEKKLEEQIAKIAKGKLKIPADEDATVGKHKQADLYNKKIKAYDRGLFKIISEPSFKRTSQNYVFNETAAFRSMKKPD